MRDNFTKVEKDIDEWYTQNISGIVSREESLAIRSLEREKLRILKIEEESWRQKTRVTWLVAGDSNTRSFHKIVEGRRKGNVIWEIIDGEGRFHIG